MNISVNEVYGYDEDGYAEKRGHGTIADLVAEKIVAKAAADDTRYTPLLTHIREVRKELIRELLRPEIEQALSEPFSKTNGYGERVGQPVTLRTLIIEEVRKTMTEPVDSYNRDKGSFVDQLVRTEVRNAFAAEVADAVKQARTAIADEIGKQVASAVTAAMKAR